MENWPAFVTVWCLYEEFEVFTIEFTYFNIYSKINIIPRELHNKLTFTADFNHLMAIIAYLALSLKRKKKSKKIKCHNTAWNPYHCTNFSFF